MKTLKKISISLILSLALFASMEKQCFLFFDNPLYAIENSDNQEESQNSVTSDSDLLQADVILKKDSYIFNLKDLPNEKVVLSNNFCCLYSFTFIWQPPKVS
jgi:hypothetical protein